LTRRQFPWFGALFLAIAASLIFQGVIRLVRGDLDALLVLDAVLIVLSVILAIRWWHGV
jgi:hypothetical protein